MSDLIIPGPPEDWKAGKDWETDSLANIEERNWPELTEVKRKNELLAHKAVGMCVPALIVGAFAIFAVTVLVYAWHILAPAGGKWLNAEQLKDIHGMIFSGAVGAALAEGSRRYLK